MPKKVLLLHLAETSGYCCQWAYVSINLHKTKKDWSKETGVCTTAIQESRSMVRDGLLACKEKDGCIRAEVRKLLADK
jgi:hypothetical protein